LGADHRHAHPDGYGRGKQRYTFAFTGSSPVLAV
jgi:hypothetical protein